VSLPGSRHEVELKKREIPNDYFSRRQGTGVNAVVAKNKIKKYKFFD
jgi:hypothetical protein